MDGVLCYMQFETVNYKNGNFLFFFLIEMRKKHVPVLLILPCLIGMLSTTSIVVARRVRFLLFIFNTLCSNCEYVVKFVIYTMVHKNCSPFSFRSSFSLNIMVSLLPLSESYILNVKQCDIECISRRMFEIMSFFHYSPVGKYTFH